MDGLKSISPFILELRCVGSDVENFVCNFCGCHDRERHLFMYFDQLQLWPNIKGANILHFAPEPRLATRIVVEQPSTYVKADLSPSSTDICPIDITKIPFQAQSFDFVICNHVLEHVPDDNKALEEIHRILKPNGHVILQTPYSDLLENSFCDPAINTDDLRDHFYGEKDHVRIYGQDLFLKIKDAGFNLQIAKHNEVFPNIDAFFYGVNPKENLIYARKKSNAF